MISKEQFVKSVAEKSGTDEKTASKVLSSVLETLTETLAGGESVQFTGFGSFQTSHVEAKTGKNPRDGSTYETPAHNKVSFRAGSKLKAAVK